MAIAAARIPVIDIMYVIGEPSAATLVRWHGPAGQRMSLASATSRGSGSCSYPQRSHARSRRFADMRTVITIVAAAALVTAASMVDAGAVPIAIHAARTTERGYTFAYRHAAPATYRVVAAPTKIAFGTVSAPVRK